MGNYNNQYKHIKNNSFLENKNINKDNIIIEDNTNFFEDKNENKNINWNNYEEMEKLFNFQNKYYLCGVKENDIYKIIDNNKLFISNEEGFKIYNLENMSMDLALKSNLKVTRPLLVLKNKNLIIASKGEKCIYILHKYKFNIIDKILLSKKTKFIHCGNLYELFNQSIAYSNESGISIYNKANNKYIFSKFIKVKGAGIYQFVSDFFIIINEAMIYLYSTKDYSKTKIIKNIYEYKSLLKIDNNTIILYNGNNDNDICSFLDINKFEIIYDITTKGIFKEILPINKSNFLISIYNNDSNNELCLSILKKRNNKYNFIYGCKVEGKSFMNINYCKKGSIFYLNNYNLFALTLNLKKLKINFVNWNLNSKPNLRLNFMLLGDCGVGKSAIIRKAIYNEFNENYLMNITSNFYILRLEINNIIIDLNLWDTPGREINRENIYYQQGTDLIIITYSINSKKSINIVNMLIKKIKEIYWKCPLIYLIGNKADLNHEREVERREGAILTLKNNLNLFMEVSAKTGTNIKNIFIYAAKQLIKRKTFSFLFN